MTVCLKCKRELPFWEFYWHAEKQKRRARCKSCVRKRRRWRYAANKSLEEAVDHGGGAGGVGSDGMGRGRAIR